MEMYEIVTKLIGSITPYGDTIIDKEHIENLEEYNRLTYELILELINVANLKDRPEGSIKEMGTMAYNNLIRIRDIIDNELESEE